MANNMLLNAALHYAELGFAVFPLKPHDKVPMTHHGCKDASRDPQQIKKWWKLCPESNIGLATGAVSNHICVVDIDIDDMKGIDGSDTLREWERENGKLPDTAIAITGRGGYHYYYKITEPIKNRANILEGIDFRGDGGYVVAPPSIHSNGNQYEWEYDIDEYPIAEADERVIKLLATAKAASNLLENYQPLDVDAIMAEGSRNDQLFRLASHYQSHSLPDEAVRALVEKANREKCTPPLEQEEVDKILGSVLSYNKGLSEEFKSAKKTKKQNKQTIQMIVDSIKEDELLSKAIRYNSLAYSPWIAGVLPWSKSGEPEQRQWTDVDDAQFQRYMEDTYGYTSVDKMLKALSIAMDDNTFSPIVEHLETLRGTWDGKPRMETLLIDFLGADDTELNRAIMRLFMFGAIARAYKPGCQFDYMLIFVGEQGVGKSTFLRKLAMSDVWFDGNFNTIDGNQAVERLRGMWMLEMSELLALKRTKDVESMKSFITNRSDNYRAPYARRTTARPRQCVFAGSTNKEMFLTDTTGNRRFMPVMTNPNKKKLDIFDDKLTKDYFEQAWAEALDVYFKEKPKLVLSTKLQKQMLELQEAFTEEDPRVGVIQEFLDNSKDDRHCILSIWREAFGRDDTPDRKTTNELHDIMRNSITGFVAEDGKKRCRQYGISRTYFRESAMFRGFESVSNEEKVPF